ncbi:MAG: Gfo/Idh/MocA family protein [Planctomycetota bacterium]
MKRYSRRRFLSTTAAGTVATFLGGYMKSASSSPNDQIAVALIGINGIGMHHVRQIAANHGARAVALCDVDDAVLARGVRRVKEMTGNTPQTTRDYRTIMDDKSIDAVVIATPHHWHCPIAVPALLAGKDVYVEKPASTNAVEPGDSGGGQGPEVGDLRRHQNHESMECTRSRLCQAGAGQ